MDWKEIALKTLIAQLIEKRTEQVNFIFQLNSFGVHIDRKELDPTYPVLKRITEDWDQLDLVLEDYRKDNLTLKQITDLIYEHVEENFKK